MKEVLRQLLSIWRELKPLQKGATLGTVLLVGALLGYLLLKERGSSYVPLYPDKILSSSDLGEIRSYLEHFSIPFTEDSEKGVLVSAGEADQIRATLAETGIPKREKGKGFELFDTNTWIKGDKELQVLEMRALKGQLEKDLALFEQIKGANVILDIPPQKSFSGPKLPTKASVILTLMPKARLSYSQLKAITNHLAGAIRGLEPCMIAISDTSGKIYKAIDTEGCLTPEHEARHLLEENLEEEIGELLARLVGEDHFYVRVQTLLDSITEEANSLSIAVVIDKRVLRGEESLFQKELERQLAALAKGCGLKVESVVDFIPFERKKNGVPLKKSGHTRGFLLFGLFAIFVLAVLVLPFFLRYKHKSKPNAEDEALFRVMTRMDMKKLAHSVENEDPQTLALMFSYLEPSRAEEMLTALNKEMQEEVLFHLAELEKEER